MPKWTDYTIKANPADKDEMMILDTAGKANKRLGLSALSDWIIGKIADKVFENLQTQNKTILGALNELNSKTSIQYINNVLPDSLRTGLYAGIYDVGSENAPSDYGMVMYLSYTYNTNKWYTAIASATNNGGVFVSTKTNGADWNGWRKLSTN